VARTSYRQDLSTDLVVLAYLERRQFPARQSDPSSVPSWASLRVELQIHGAHQRGQHRLRSEVLTVYRPQSQALRILCCKPASLKPVTKFRPTLSHPHVRRTVKHRFLVTPGTGTCSLLFNKQTKKLTEPEQGWFRREPSLELIAYFFGCDHNQLIHQPVKRYFWHVSGYLLLIYNQMLPRQVLVADEILTLFYSCRSRKSTTASVNLDLENIISDSKSSFFSVPTMY
jgi:hypothetical protein